MPGKLCPICTVIFSAGGRWLGRQGKKDPSSNLQAAEKLQIPSVQIRHHPLSQRSSMNDSFFDANRLNRRGFLKTSGTILGAAGLAGLSQVSAAAATKTWPPAVHSLVRKGEVILFQGDSITDAGRSREKAGVPNEQSGLGSGYAWLVGAELLVDRPRDGLKVYNRGISGNKVFQ